MLPQIVPPKVLNLGEFQGGVEAVLDVLHGSPTFGPDVCGKTYALSGSRAAWSVSSVLLAVMLSGTESGRPPLVRGIRITLLPKSI